MERLRKSFRRKGREKGGRGLEEENKEVETANFTELTSSQTFKPPPQTRMARLRQSLRIKKSKSKKEDETKKEEEVLEDPIQIEPFDKKSKFRKSLNFGKKKSKKTTKKKSSKFESDEESVRAGRCSFAVKYLGSVEVEESRGMEVCETSGKQLRKQKKKPMSATLHVSGDGLRVVDKKNSGMLVDQVIEKVSFCSPDRDCDKGFSYICRDGTTRRWLCHCFLSKEESGERLSHAVGVAFSICLERKQQREVDCGVSMSYNETDGTFTKFGSFRQGTISERIQDPQNFKPSSPPPIQKVENPHAVARPHATDLMFQRQGSFKGLGTLAGNSPFKRGSAYSSLRETALPSTLQRQEKSRISLILEENFEDEELKNEINNLMNKMAAERFNNKNNNNNVSNKNSAKPTTDTENEKQVARVLPLQQQQQGSPVPYSLQQQQQGSPVPYSLQQQQQGSPVPYSLQQQQQGSPVPYSPSPEIIKFTPATPSALPPPNNAYNPSPEIQFTPAQPDPLPAQQPPRVNPNAWGETGSEKNPWDLVPDQFKFKQHSRSNSKAEMSKENPADNWLASLTSKISDVGDNNNTFGFKEKDHDDDLDNEFAELANRNRIKNTNPFKAVV